MKDEKHRPGGHAATPANNPKKDPAGISSKQSKQDRLKLALRANLKRRKSQARARGDLASAPSNRDEASPYDESGKNPGE
jgi:hypothetical protein